MKVIGVVVLAVVLAVVVRGMMYPVAPALPGLAKEGFGTVVSPDLPPAVVVHNH